MDLRFFAISQKLGVLWIKTQMALWANGSENWLCGMPGLLFRAGGLPFPLFYTMSHNLNLMLIDQLPGSAKSPSTTSTFAEIQVDKFDKATMSHVFLISTECRTFALLCRWPGSGHFPPSQADPVWGHMILKGCFALLYLLVTCQPLKVPRPA